MRCAEPCIDHVDSSRGTSGPFFWMVCRIARLSASNSAREYMKLGQYSAFLIALIDV